MTSSERPRTLEKLAEEKGCELHLPERVLVADAFDANANTQVVSSDAIPDGWMGLDNGPAATKMIQDKLADCKTVIWNGPMGVFEMDAFAKGTFAICDTLKELTEKGAITIIGGGDSVAAVEKAGLADAMSAHSNGRRRVAPSFLDSKVLGRRRARRGLTPWLRTPLRARAGAPGDCRLRTTRYRPVGHSSGVDFGRFDLIDRDVRERGVGKSSRGDLRRVWRARVASPRARRTLVALAAAARAGPFGAFDGVLLRRSVLGLDFGGLRARRAGRLRSDTVRRPDEGSAE